MTQKEQTLSEWLRQEFEEWRNDRIKETSLLSNLAEFSQKFMDEDQRASYAKAMKHIERYKKLLDGIEIDSLGRIYKTYPKTGCISPEDENKPDIRILHELHVWHSELVEEMAGCPEFFTAGYKVSKGFFDILDGYIKGK